MSFYQKFLYFIGFPAGLTISSNLARQKQRLGWVWHLLVWLTIILSVACPILLIILYVHILRMPTQPD